MRVKSVCVQYINYYDCYMIVMIVAYDSVLYWNIVLIHVKSVLRI